MRRIIRFFEGRKTYTVSLFALCDLFYLAHTAAPTRETVLHFYFVYVLYRIIGKIAAKR